MECGEGKINPGGRGRGVGVEVGVRGGGWGGGVGENAKRIVAMGR